MTKQVLRYKDIREKILSAVDTIADPIAETMSPKGRNVIFEDEYGNYKSTNDGVTIAKSINVKDPVQNAIISMLKMSSEKSNTEVGDGTSTTLKLSQILIKEGFKLIDAGYNQMDIRHSYEKAGNLIIEKLKDKAQKIKDDKDLERIARVSSNNDEEIAKNVVRIVKTAGQDGMVFLDPNVNGVTTEITEDNGFNIESGILFAELRNDPRKFTANYTNIPVLITDKRIYYKEEAETILQTVLNMGKKEVVIVARDFVGPCVNFFVANHVQGTIKVLLVKEPRANDKDNDALYDLAVYLGGTVVSEKSGSLVNNLDPKQFVVADRVFADGARTLIVTKKKKNKELENRVEALKKELAKDKDDETIKKRIASLTNGIVNIKVGGATRLEVIERVYRYDDAVHAARAAMEDGYLVGGGVTMLSLLDEIKGEIEEVLPVFKAFCEASTRQIALNCGEHAESIVKITKEENKGKKVWTKGYNAITGEIEDLLKTGIIDPFKVTEMAIRNSISVASQIISSNFLIVNEAEEESDKK